jgi:hypothetical protein
VSRSISIVGDAPNANPGLGFERYVGALADAIRGASPAQCTFGLYGSWGSGKSSILAALEGELASDADVLVVPFDAWRHERAIHIVVPLLHAVSRAAERRQRFKAAGKQIGRVLAALLASAEYSRAGLTVSGERFLTWFKTLGKPSLETEFERPFAELRKIPATLAQSRIVVLVDDLDRCSPAKVVDLLEALNLVTDVEGFLFVLALDYDVLVAAVTERYPHVSGHSFIEKLVQVPFRVPAPDTSERTFLRDVIPNWGGFVAAHSGGVVDALTDVVDLALAGNPRQVKRLVNSYLLIERIIEVTPRKTSNRQLLALLAMQLAWPGAYRDVHDSILMGMSDPFEDVRDTSDQRLTRFVAKFFDGSELPDDLSDIVRLAFAVEAPSPQVDQTTEIQALDLRSAGEVTRELASRGWYQSALGSSRVWHHPLRSDLEIIVAPRSFRLHRIDRYQDATRSRSIGSFVFAQAEEGLAYIDAVLAGAPGRPPRGRGEEL